jgi:hypothetical protein
MYNGWKHLPSVGSSNDHNTSNILNRKEVVKEIPPYFKNQSIPIVSYSYTTALAVKCSTTKKHCKILT